VYSSVAVISNAAAAAAAAARRCLYVTNEAAAKQATRNDDGQSGIISLCTTTQRCFMLFTAKRQSKIGTFKSVQMIQIHI
jgi:hypothetical protein